MIKDGYSYELLPQPNLGAPHMNPIERRDLAKLRSDGYGFTDLYERNTDTNLELAPPPPLHDASYLKSLEKCGESVIDGPIAEQRWSTMVLDINAKVWSLPKYAETLRRWSECIAQAGFPGVKDPFDAFLRIQRLYSSAISSPDDQRQYATLKAEEKALAAADATCSEKYQASFDEARSKVISDSLAQDSR